jgi:hypothetical protein
MRTHALSPPSALVRVIRMNRKNRRYVQLAGLKSLRDLGGAECGDDRSYGTKNHSEASSTNLNEGGRRTTAAGGASSRSTLLRRLLAEEGFEAIWVVEPLD